MWSETVELPHGYGTVEIAQAPCEREHYVTYEVTGSRVCGSVTFNTQPWSNSDSHIWVTAGKVSAWTLNGPQFTNDLVVDGCAIQFSGELPRGNPFPIRKNIYGQGLEFERTDLIPPTTRDYASAVIDAVVGVWHENDNQTSMAQ
ncbi:MAG: hypothetical protein ACREP9_22740 [Candidatus Dormibacteraceae bacterium]